MYACVDIGGTSIKVALSDKKGKLKEKGKLEICDDFDDLANNIINWVETLKDKYIIEGLAISAPGAVDTKTGIIGGDSAVPCIHGPNFKEYFGERLNLNVSVENDANCAALAEVFSGNASEIKDMLFVVCGTGIGGAIVKDRKIHHGKNLYGGEFGYMIMEEVDGKFKTFSECASTMSFVRKVRKYYGDDSWDGKKIFLEANKGDEVCIKAIDTFYRNLAKGIFNLQHIYDPEVILLGGGISDREEFISRLNEEIEYIISKFTDKTVKPKIGTCIHKSDANLIGALSNYLNEYGN